MPNVGPMEVLLLALLALLLFGPSKLPEIGRSIGKGIREFKDGLSEHTSDLSAALDSDPPTEIDDELLDVHEGDELWKARGGGGPGGPADVLVNRSPPGRCDATPPRPRHPDG